MTNNTNSKRYKDVMKRLFSYMKPFKVGLFFSFFLIILSSLFNGFGPFILGKATDTILLLTLGNEQIETTIKKFITILIILFCCYFLYPSELG